MACARVWMVFLLAGCDFEKTPLPDLGVDMAMIAPADLHTPHPATKCGASGPARVLSNLPGTHALPRIGWTGSSFVVAWNTAIGGQNRIDVQPTDPQGSKLGPNIPLSQNPIANGDAPSVSSLINGTVVAWTRASGSSTDIVIDTLDANGQRLDANGKACDPAQVDCGIFPVTTSGTAGFPYLARPEVDQHTASPVDSQVGLAFADSRNYPCSPPTPPCTSNGYNDVFWKKISANGSTIVQEKRITAAGANTHNEFPRLAFDGVHDSLVWRDSTNPSNVFYWFATLDSIGQLSSGPTKVGTTSGSFVTAGAPDLLWTGMEYALAITNGSDAQSSVIFERLQSNGTPNLQPVGVTFGGVACTPAIAWDGDFFAVVWQTDCGQPGSQLAFELVDSTGTRWKPDGTSCGTSVDANCGVQLLTSNSTEVAAFPEIVWAGGTSFGVAWMNTSRTDGSFDSEVWFSRVDCEEP